MQYGAFTPYFTLGWFGDYRSLRFLCDCFGGRTFYFFGGIGMNYEFVNATGSYFVTTDEGVLTKDFRKKETVFIPYGNIMSVKRVAILRGIEIRYTDNRCFSYIYSADEKKEIKECLKFLQQKRLQSKRGEVITAPIDDALKQTIREKSSQKPDSFLTFKGKAFIVVALIVIFLFIMALLGAFDGSGSSGKKWSDLNETEKENAKWSYEVHNALNDE